MPPEQARGDLARVGPRSDVYSLGATLYDRLAGRTPFVADTVVDLLVQILEQEPEPLRRHLPGADRDLETIVMKCLEKDPARRYAVAADLADDLTRWLGGEAIEARPPSRLYRMRKGIARRRPLAAALAAALILATAATAFLVRWREARRESDAGAARLAEAQLFLPASRELDMLQLHFYRPDFRLTAEELSPYEKLVTDVRGLMERNRPSADGWCLIGRCHEVLGAPTEAAAAYDRALALDAGHAGAMIHRGRLALEETAFRRTRLTTPELSLEVISDARAAVDMVRRGEAALGRGGSMELDFALAWLEIVEGRRPPPARGAMERWRGRPLVEDFLIIEGMWEGREAIHAAAREVAKRVPSHFKAHYMAAATATGGEEALAGLDRAIEINPRYAEAHSMKGVVLRKRAVELLKRGRRDEALADLNAAVACHERALALEPRNVLMLTNGALTLSERADARTDGAPAERQTAEDLCGRALAIDPRHIHALLVRGQVRRARGNLDGARADFDAAIALVPDDPSAYAQRARVRLAAGDAAGAATDFDAAIQRNPRHGPALLSRALQRLERGDSAGALADLDGCVAVDPGEPVAWSRRGVALQRLGRVDDALASYDRALKLDPAHADAYVNRSAARLVRGEHEAAVADCTKALAIDARRADAYLNRALAESALGRADAAAADYTRVLEIEPGHRQALFNRAIHRSQRKDDSGARADLDRLLRLDPRHADAFVERGNVRGRQGDAPGKVEDYEAALRVAPEGWNLRDAVEKALRKLRSK